MTPTPACVVPCPDLDAEAWRFDLPSGLTHWHLTTKFPQQHFVLQVPTALHESTGVAHILEHLALCGSRAFPVKGMFHKMQQRSLASFMNAFTARTTTTYLFSTHHTQDFRHLTQVYLDAVFNPLLTPEDFRQEGWRWELDAQGEPFLTGVVYNEMKGARENPEGAKFAAFLRAVAPGTALAQESGGDPDLMPSLTHEHLRATHARYYDPRRCTLVTAGPINLAALHADLLSGTPSRTGDVWPIEPQKPRPLPHLDAVHPGDDATASLTRCWLLPAATAEEEWLNTWMSMAFLLQPGSPLSEALTAHQGVLDGLAGIPSPAEVGLVDHQPLLLGTQGHEDPLATLLPDLVAQWRAPGFDARAVLEPMLDQMEDHLKALPERDPGVVVQRIAAEVLHRSIRLDGTLWLQQQRQRLASGEASALLHQWLDIWHTAPCSRIVHHPDPELVARRQQDEDARVNAFRQDITPEQRRLIANTGVDILHADENVLPALASHELLPPFEPSQPRHWTPPSPSSSGVAAVEGQASFAHVGVVWDVSGWSDVDIQHLRWWCLLAPVLGARSRTWSEQAQCEQAAGLSFSAGFHIQGRQDGKVLTWASLQAHGPADRLDTLPMRMLDRLEALQWDDVDLFRNQLREWRVTLATEQSDRLYHQAQQAAAAPFSQVMALEQQFRGMASVQADEALIQACLDSPTHARETLDLLRALDAKLRSSPKMLTVEGQPQAHRVAHDLANSLPGPYLADVHDLAPRAASLPLPGAFIPLPGALQVNHTALARPGPSSTDDDAAAWNVACAILDRRLHESLREQGGAYGAHAELMDGCVVLSSYRDPRRDGSLRDMAISLASLAAQEVSPEDILAAQTQLAQLWWRPQSPEKKTRSSLLRWMTGWEDAHRQARRAATLAVTPASLLASARHWESAAIQTAAAVPAQVSARPRP